MVLLQARLPQFRVDRIADIQVTEVSFRPRRIPMLRDFVATLNAGAPDIEDDLERPIAKTTMQPVLPPTAFGLLFADAGHVLTAARGRTAVTASERHELKQKCLAHVFALKGCEPATPWSSGMMTRLVPNQCIQ